MAMKVKWDITGKGDAAWTGEFQSYEGEVPPKGNYVARLKRMTLGAIKGGLNPGKPRISVLLEIVGGAGSNGVDDPEYPYRGAPVWDGLNIIKAQTGKVNNFLHALTDGEDNSKRAVETAFWPPNGPKAEKVVKDGKKTVHITQIGKYAIGSPDGHLLVRIVTKMGHDLEGNPRAEVSQYLPYIEKGANNGAVVQDDDEDEDLGETYESSDDEDEDEDELDLEYEEDEGDIQDLDTTNDEPPF
jgi:hypothetical protein